MSRLTPQQKRDRALLRRLNSQFPKHLVEIPRDKWPISVQVSRTAPVRVLRSCDYLVQVFQESGGLLRLTLNRAEVGGESYADKIPWDDLQRLKSQAGYGDRDAVEVYPMDVDLVDVAAMRHLWVFPYELPFKWRAPRNNEAGKESKTA